MKVRTLRQKIQRWFSEKVRVDSWQIDPPPRLATPIGQRLYPANSAMEAPLRDVRLDPSEGTTTLTLPYMVCYRFSKSLKEHQLPIVEVETLYSNAVLSWLTEGVGLDPDIISVSYPSQETPIAVTRSEDVSDDWLVMVFFEFQVTCILELDSTALQPDTDPADGWEVRELRFGVWRSTLEDVGNPETSTLDCQLHI